jgi:hypothetical protein
VEEEWSAVVRVWRYPCRWDGKLIALDQPLGDPQVVGVDAQAGYDRQQGDGQENPKNNSTVHFFAPFLELILTGLWQKIVKQL